MQMNEGGWDERVKRRLLINNSRMGSINNRAPYVMSVAALAVGMQLATNTCSLWIIGGFGLRCDEIDLSAPIPSLVAQYEV